MSFRGRTAFTANPSSREFTLVSYLTPIATANATRPLRTELLVLGTIEALRSPFEAFIEPLASCPEVALPTLQFRSLDTTAVYGL